MDLNAGHRGKKIREDYCWQKWRGARNGVVEKDQREVEADEEEPEMRRQEKNLERRKR